MKAVVLAAGKGIRMLPLTKEVPKAMIKINSKPMLEYILHNLSEVGISECCIVVGYKKEKIMNYFRNSFEGIKIRYAIQRKLLGTAHALQKAEWFAKQEFLLCYADIIPNCTVLKKLIEHKGKMVAAIHFEKNAEFFGVVEFKNGKIVNIIEKPKGARNKYVLSGIYKLSPEIFKILTKIKKNPERNEYELTDALKIIAKKNTLHGLKIEKSSFLNVGTIEDLKNIESKFEFFCRS